METILIYSIATITIRPAAKAPTVAMGVAAAPVNSEGVEAVAFSEL